MANEVKLSLEPTRYEALVALLRYQAGKINADQLKSVLLGLGYKEEALEHLDAQVRYIAEQSLKAIQ